MRIIFKNLDIVKKSMDTGIFLSSAHAADAIKEPEARKNVPKAFPFIFWRVVYPAKEPRKARLGLGVRFWVARSTATRPKVMEKPFCHSKLSRRDQWK